MKLERKPDKYHLNLAGEYRVCSELLKRGIFATVTFGNMKGADVVLIEHLDAHENAWEKIVNYCGSDA